MLETAFMVCATYRDPNKLSPLRRDGILYLIEDAKKQTYDGIIRLAIVDSSPTAHPFFVSPAALLAEHGIAYIHVPHRGEELDWRKTFPDSSRFIPTNADLETDVWQLRQRQMQAWDYFLPFEEGFRQAYKGPKPSEFITFDRPAIGMKKNLGVAALAETFGAGDHIIFCDDDDRRHPGYVGELAGVLRTNDFVRPTHWITMVVGKNRDQDVWGRYDVPFIKDVNGNWQIPNSHLDAIFQSSMQTPEGQMYVRSVAEKFSRSLNLAFPPLSHDGALHGYRYDTWERAVAAFGGCAPTSFCEDMLFYRLCIDDLRKFTPAALTTEGDLFIRCADGSNASLIEWNEHLPFEYRPAWAVEAMRQVAQSLQHGQIDPMLMQQAGHKFLQTGVIDWKLIHAKDRVCNPAPTDSLGQGPR